MDPILVVLGRRPAPRIAQSQSQTPAPVQA
jgi:hypothetical protein